MQAIRAYADGHARNLQPIVTAVVDKGVPSPSAVANALNDRA